MIGNGGTFYKIILRDPSGQRNYGTDIETALASIKDTTEIHLAPGTYSINGNASLPAYPITVYGNKSILNVSGKITLNNIHSIYDLNTVGAVEYAYTGPERSIRNGGSINGAMSIDGGFPHFDNLNYTGNLTITGGTPYFNGITGGGQIIVNGANAEAILNDANMNRENVSAANIIVTLGQLIAKGGLFTNKGDVPNIVFNNSNIISKAHSLTQIICNYGISCETAYTIIAPDCVIPIITGSAIMAPVAIPYFGIGGGTAQVQTATIPFLASGYYPGMEIKYVASVGNTGAAPTLNVNTLGAKTVLKRSGAALVAGDISIGAIITAIYDGTYFRVMSA